MDEKDARSECVEKGVEAIRQQWRDRLRRRRYKKCSIAQGKSRNVAINISSALFQFGSKMALLVIFSNEIQWHERQKPDIMEVASAGYAFNFKRN